MSHPPGPLAAAPRWRIREKAAGKRRQRGTRRVSAWCGSVERDLYTLATGLVHAKAVLEFPGANLPESPAAFSAFPWAARARHRLLYEIAPWFVIETPALNPQFYSSRHP